MATLASEVSKDSPVAKNRQRIALLLFLIAVAVAIAKLFTPAVDLRLPEGQGLLPWADWLDRFFNLIKGDIQEGRFGLMHICLLYTSPSPRDATLSRMPSSA